MTLTHKLKSILTYAFLNASVVGAADMSTALSDAQVKTLDSIRPQVVSLKQSLSVITQWIENTPSIKQTPVTDLSETATHDQINDILVIALEYVLDKEKSETLKKIHKVSGKATQEEDMSVYFALLDMCKMIDDLQNKLYTSFGTDDRPESKKLRKQLEGVVKFDTLVSQKPRSLSKAEIMALDFIRTKSIELNSSSSSSSSSNSPDSSPPSTPVTRKSPVISVIKSSGSFRPKSAVSPIGNAYADSNSLSSSPVFQRMRAASSSEQTKKNDSGK